MRNPPTTYIGYWNDAGNHYPEFPFPEEGSGSPEDIKEALSLLAIIESSKNTRTLHYRGMSSCRICSTMNGSAELEICIRNKKNDIVEKICIPAGYKHYLLDHKVKPDLDLLRKAAKAA